MLPSVSNSNLNNITIIRKYFASSFSNIDSPDVEENILSENKHKFYSYEKQSKKNSTNHNENYIVSNKTSDNYAQERCQPGAISCRIQGVNSLRYDSNVYYVCKPTPGPLRSLAKSDSNAPLLGVRMPLLSVEPLSSPRLPHRCEVEFINYESESSVSVRDSRIGYRSKRRKKLVQSQFEIHDGKKPGSKYKQNNSTSPCKHSFEMYFPKVQTRRLQISRSKPEDRIKRDNKVKSNTENQQNVETSYFAASEIGECENQIENPEKNVNIIEKKSSSPKICEKRENDPTSVGKRCENRVSVSPMNTDHKLCNNASSTEVVRKNSTKLSTTLSPDKLNKYDESKKTETTTSNFREEYKKAVMVNLKDKKRHSIAIQLHSKGRNSRDESQENTSQKFRKWYAAKFGKATQIQPEIKAKLLESRVKFDFKRRDCFRTPSLPNGTIKTFLDSENFSSYPPKRSTFLPTAKHQSLTTPNVSSSLLPVESTADNDAPRTRAVFDAVCFPCCRQPDTSGYSNMIENHRLARIVTLIAIVTILVLVLTYIIRSVIESSDNNEESTNGTQNYLS